MVSLSPFFHQSRKIVAVFSDFNSDTNSHLGSEGRNVRLVLLGTNYSVLSTLTSLSPKHANQRLDGPSLSRLWATCLPSRIEDLYAVWFQMKN